jgi:endonuclease-3
MRCGTNPFQLLVALSSKQCTDERVNMVTPELFTSTSPQISHAQQEVLEQDIRSTDSFAINQASSAPRCVV